MQKLVKAAKEGTKDGLEKTKAVVKRGRSFIRTKSFASAGLRGAASGRLPGLGAGSGQRGLRGRQEVE